MSMWARSRKGWRVWLSLATILAIACVVLISRGAARAGVSTLSAVADAYVRADKARSNFGKATGIRVDRDPVATGFVRFQVSVPAGETVTQATLKVFPMESSGSGFSVHRVADNSWSETTINYSNAPRVGSRVAASGAYSGDAYVSVDVTSLVAGSGDVSLALTRDSTSSNTYSSREAASNRPQLVVEKAPAPPVSSAETIVYALGDGADGSTTSRALADYVKAQDPDRFFYLGDVYETGTASEFNSNYEPLYGPMASRTDPVIGNHEYSNRSTGYYEYWANKRGWTHEQSKHRSYVDANSGWQIIAYSSETAMAAEGAWVAGEVAKRSGTCRIVMAHRGRHVVADTTHGDNTDQEPVWSKIINKTAINLVGHNHIYGRLAPLNGVTVVVSGAGGHGLRPLGTQHHTVAASTTAVATATRLVLRRGSASLSQVDKDGHVYDTDSIACSPAR